MHQLDVPLPIHDQHTFNDKEVNIESKKLK
jgi:hypothetical protein